MSTSPEPTAAALTPEARRQILQNAIHRYIAGGWRVISQTDSAAQLIKPKKFSFVTFVLLVFACGVGFLYLGWYLAKKDQTVYLQVTESGNLIET